MPKKKRKERVWEYGMPKGPVPPFVYHVWFKKANQPERFVAFDEDHIRLQCEPRVPIVIEQVHEIEDPDDWEPLGPEGSEVNRPADYDTGFKLLQEWVDSQGGPPESVRKKLRELYIDYRKVDREKSKK